MLDEAPAKEPKNEHFDSSANQTLDFLLYFDRLGSADPATTRCWGTLQNRCRSVIGIPRPT
jgi:hypothetical protein